MIRLKHLEQIHEDIEKMLDDNLDLPKMVRQHLIEANTQIDMAMDIISLTP